MKSVDQLLAGMADVTRLAGVREAMREDQRLRQSISRIVPPATLAQLAFCRLEQGVLHLSVADAAWLTRLRFVERSLLKELVQDGWTVQSLKGHVLPRRAPVRQRRAIRPAPVGSSDGALGIRQLAESLESGRLKTALDRMAMHVARHDGNHTTPGDD